MKRICTLVLTALALALGVVGQANAGMVNGSVWLNQSVAANNATIAQAAGLGVANATFTTNSINYFMAGGGNNQLATFLNNPADLSGNNTASIQNAYFLFTGYIQLSAGSHTISIAHDDGIQLQIGSTLVLNHPLPTSPTTTSNTFNAGAGGIFAFTLSYGEVAGLPAQLNSFTVDQGAAQIVSGVPEPASMAMLGIGALGLLGYGWRKRKQNAAIKTVA